MRRYQAPIRDPTSKWYMPKIYFSAKAYPDFISGQAYLLSGFIVEKLLKQLYSYSGDILRFEDVFITGIIAKLAGISRRNSKLFYDGCERKCMLTKLAVACACDNSARMELRLLEMKFPDKLCTEVI